MRPIHLNLAARPYRDYRPVYAVAIVGGLLTAFLMFLNIQTAVRYFTSTRETRAQIAQIESEAAAERRRAEAIEAGLQRVDFKTLNLQSAYINTQIAERVFSWSNLLDRLEKVAPNDVRLTSLNPSIQPDGSVRLELACAAKDPDGLVDFLNRLLASPYFERPFPQSENTGEEGASRFRISVIYRPDPVGLIE